MSPAPIFSYVLILKGLESAGFVDIDSTGVRASSSTVMHWSATLQKVLRVLLEKHHREGEINFRWCYIDLLSPSDYRELRS